MADSDNDKQRIAAALSASRTELKNFFFQLRHNLDIRPYLLESREKHVWGWMSAAAIFGWILSGLPARKQKIYIHSSDPRKAEKKLEWTGFLIPVWVGAWSIAKPLVAAYLTKKIKKVGEKAKLQGGNAVAEAIRWATRFLREIKIESRSS
jgi:hypothetical protein